MTRHLVVRHRCVSVALGAVAALVTWLAPAAACARPHHSGFTGDLGLGFAVTFAPEYRGTATCSAGPGALCSISSEKRHPAKPGLAPLSLSLGGFATPKVAILARVSGVSYFESGDQISSTFYGGIVELWPLDEIYVSGGVGFALTGGNPFFNRNATQTAGWALDFRVGSALVQGTNHDFTLSLEVIPGFYDGEVITGGAVVGAWKWY